jgi:eukaryotic-like serine/threonine-protein kinase
MLDKQFGHYVVLEQAGAGAMGVVYRARDERLQREVALKIPAEGAVLTEELRAKWLAEARAASGLNHPNICTIYEVGEYDGQLYIAMEYLRGRSLNASIPDDGLPTETVLEYGAQIASALEYAHTHGVLHRDLKSANVRQSGAGQVKVLDFGLAAVAKDASSSVETQSSPSSTSGAPGTLAYLSPEVLSGTPADARADIWALGVLLYEMASRTYPFPGRTIYELCSSILREAPRPLPMHVPPGLRAIILRCLAKHPEQRYQRASEVKAALEALHSNGGMMAAAAAAGVSDGDARARYASDSSGKWKFVNVEEEAKRTARRRRWWALAVGLVGVAALLYLLPLAKSRLGAPTPGGRLRQLVATQKGIGAPGLSPDGKMLAYAEQGELGDDLYVMRVAGGERMQLTHDISRKDGPVFSPDGEKIAFARKAPGESAEEVCTISTLGGEITTVVQGGVMPAWSPDGTRLVVVSRKAGEPEKLAIVWLEGRQTKTILAGDAVRPFLGRPAWSPDGKTIAVSRSIWLVPAEGGEAKDWMHESTGEFSDTPVFSADGRGIVFQSNRSGARNIWYMDMNGNHLMQLTKGAGPDSQPTVARDGAMAFLNSRTKMLLLLYDLENGESKTVLTESAILWAPVFSPDGKVVTYSRGAPDGSWHLWSVAREGGAARQVTSGKALEIYGRYAPDGQELFFNTWGQEPVNVGAISKSGATRMLVAKNGASDAYADVSADGKWVVFGRTEERVSHLYVRAADGSGEARRVGSMEGTVPRWSPDGKWIAFSPNRGFGGGVFVVHADGSGLKRVTEKGGWPVWWPDGEQIGMQTSGPDGNMQVTVAKVSTGETRVLGGLRFFGDNYPFDVSRDGKWLVTTNEVGESNEIWLLERE